MRHSAVNSSSASHCFWRVSSSSLSHQVINWRVSVCDSGTTDTHDVGETSRLKVTIVNEQRCACWGGCIAKGAAWHTPPKTRSARPFPSPAGPASRSATAQGRSASKGGMMILERRDCSAETLAKVRHSGAPQRNPIRPWPRSPAPFLTSVAIGISHVKASLCRPPAVAKAPGAATSFSIAAPFRATKHQSADTLAPRGPDLSHSPSAVCCVTARAETRAGSS